MSENIFVTLNGERASVLVGSTVSEISNGEMPCGGNGRCGKCKVFAKGALSELSRSEKELLSEEEIASGIRLACSARVLGECEISTFEPRKDALVITDGEMPQIALKPIFSRFGVSVDVGTTTLAARLYNTSGKILATSTALNPQSVLGADVISRIKASLEGNSEKLKNIIVEAIDALIADLCSKADIAPCEIDALVVTGNTAMLYLLVGSSPRSLSCAPFEADRLFGEEITAGALGLSLLSSTAKIYLPPCISAFVGADTVCALLATELCDTDSTRLMADVGTNGEIALFSDGSLFVCSTAAGPAFEGVGISCGMRGEDGAIDKVTLVNGAPLVHVLGDKQAVGICGSGIVDAISVLLDLETVDETGYMEDEETTLAKGVTLTQADIRAVQLAKGAISAGISTLLHTSKLDVNDIDELLIAGGFGSHLDVRNAVRIGLIPNCTPSKIKSVGNAALAGASMLLLNAELGKKAKEIANSARVTELASNPTFAEFYMSAMMF
ncbi:MAG: DUF4445 domain-containing protein [Ruminococcaceae bacterium]|nr:DUF4445 domain-containing protein [Oscillospiraceae bacterium]